MNALLDLVKPVLREHGFVLMQPIVNGCLSTMIVDIETGRTELISTIELPKIDDPQKMGSAITYYRRYTLQSLLGIQAEDDDGNGGKRRDRNKLTEAQRKKLMLPHNQKFIPKYLEKYTMSDKVRKDLEVVYKKSQES